MPPIWQPWSIVRWLRSALLREEWIVLWVVLAFAVVMAVVLSLVGCSSTAERFDRRPDMCRDLGKRGAEC